jgi:hypothetical protein
MEVFGFREHILLNLHYSELLKVGDRILIQDQTIAGLR